MISFRSRADCSNRQASFERCLTPAAVVTDGTVVDDRIIQFIDDFPFVRHGAPQGHRDFSLAMIIVNEHAVWLWAQVAVFTAHQCDAEMRMVTLAFNGANRPSALLSPTVSGGGFEVRFIRGIFCFA